MTKKATIYSDGGARGNPGPAAVGILICDAKGEPVREHKERIGETTNNVAEYTAVIVALELAIAEGITDVDYYVDSELVAKQLNGEYKVKKEHIRVLHGEVKKRCVKFHKITFTQVPRTHEKLKYVDRLVNLALDGRE